MYIDVHTQTIFIHLELKLETLVIFCRELDLSFIKLSALRESVQVLEKFYVNGMV